MTGGGESGRGTGGTSFNPGSLQFPGVPFGPTDFNGGGQCQTGDGSIHNYGSANEVRNCRLVGLLDLMLGKDYVRQKVAGYMNHLISIGVGGFRVDAAKHMWPADLTNIFGRLSNLNTAYFPSGTRPFIFQEVIDMGGEAIGMSEYSGIGRVTNFIYGIKLAQVFRNQNQAKYLRNWGEQWGMPSTSDSVVFIDNHDNQRGHGGGGESIRPIKTPVMVLTISISTINHGENLLEFDHYLRHDSDDIFFVLLN